MIFETIEKELALAKKAFDISNHKAQAIVECAAMDAAIQMEESEFKIFQESGSDDELMAFYEEAQEGLIGKIQKGINVIVDGLKKFFAALKDKIISIFKKKEVEESIKEIGIKAKLPFFKTQKVEIKDTEAQFKVLDKFKAKYQSILAKLKSGGDVSDDEITETRENFLKEHAVAVGASITVTLAVAIGLLLKYHKSLDSDVNETESDATKELSKLAELGDKVGEKAEKLMKAAKHAAEVAKDRGETIVTSVSSILTAIKSKVLKKTDINKKQEESFEPKNRFEQESTEDDSIFNSEEFSFMKEAGSDKPEPEVQPDNNDIEYNSDWITKVFGN